MPQRKLGRPSTCSGLKGAAVLVCLCFVLLPVSVRGKVPLDPVGMYGSEQQAQQCLMSTWNTCKSFMQRTGVIANFLRLIFHDCGTYWHMTDDGGCNGSVLHEIDVQGGPGLGLEDSVGLIPNITAQLHQSGCPGQSAADTIVVCGAAAVSFLGGPTCPLYMGRKDSDNSTSDDPFRLPTPCMADPQLILNAFDGMGFRDPVLSAAMLAVGGHDIGVAHIGHPCVSSTSTTVSDPGPLSTTSGVFDGGYFNDVVAGSGKFDSDKSYMLDSGMRGYITRFANAHDQFLNMWCEHYQEMSLLGVDPGDRPINGGWMPDGTAQLPSLTTASPPRSPPSAAPPPDVGTHQPPPPLQMGNFFHRL